MWISSCSRFPGIVTRLGVIGLLGLAAGCDKNPAAQPAAVTSGSATTPPHAVSGAAAAAPASPDAGQTFGAGVSLAQATPVDQILADPKRFRGQTVRVEGMVLDVCPKRGCWFDLAGTAAGQKLRFKVTDGEMVFPMESKGLRAIAQGQVALNELTLEQSREYAAYQAKEYGAPIDPASITEPMTIVRIDGTGAVFLASASGR